MADDDRSLELVGNDAERRYLTSAPEQPKKKGRSSDAQR
jgi:hypothetical protein